MGVLSVYTDSMNVPFKALASQIDLLKSVFTPLLSSFVPEIMSFSWDYPWRSFGNQEKADHSNFSRRGFSAHEPETLQKIRLF